jgi:hypothetical protein
VRSVQKRRDETGLIESPRRAIRRTVRRGRTGSPAEAAPHTVEQEPLSPRTAETMCTWQRWNGWWVCR